MSYSGHDYSGGPSASPGSSGYERRGRGGWQWHRNAGNHGGRGGGHGNARGGDWSGRHGGGRGGGDAPRGGGDVGPQEAPAGPSQAAPSPGTALDFSPPPAAAMLDPALRREVDGYVRRFGPLVQMELDEERRLVQERLRTWPMSRLVSEGHALLDLKAARRGSYLGKAIVRLTLADGRDLPFHRFTSGTLVTLCRRNPLSERPSEGMVLDRSRRDLRLAMDRPPPDLTTGVWRVDKGANIVTYQRMAAALRALYKQPNLIAATSGAAAGGDGEGCCDEDGGDYDDGGGAGGSFGWGGGAGRGVRGRGRGRGRGHGGGGDKKRRRRQQQEEEEEDTLPPGTYLTDVLMATSAAATAEAAARPAPLVPVAGLQWAEAHGDEPDDPRAEDPLMGLNLSQVHSLALALQHRMVLLQGPPGTGKTTTITRFIFFLKHVLRYPHPILACAQSNVAVDNLLEGLVDLGVGAVRVGQPVKVRESLRDATLDARILAHPAQAAIEEQQDQLRDLRQRLPSLRGRDRGLGHRDVQIMQKQLRELRGAMMAEILQGADVICSTCVGAGGDQLEGLSFGLVVLDEGSQCSEPESLIPLVQGCCHAVLVGDHCQLPPVCQSEQAARGGLSRSLFERLIGAGVPSCMLQVQYRMHPAIAAFPATRFYGGRLLDGVTTQERLPPPSLPLPPLASGSPGPLMFVDVVDGREEVSQGGSKSNRAEAQVVVKLVKHMLAAGISPGDIGVVTPYVAQVQLLSNLLMPVVPALGPPASGPCFGGGPWFGSSGPSLEVSSVDGYQGREKEIMVFSTVRANSSASIGFLEDWRRLNVAITRPRRALIIVGNAATLRRGDASAGPGSGSGGSGGHWAAYMSWLAEQRGGVVVNGLAGLVRLGWRV